MKKTATVRTMHSGKDQVPSRDSFRKNDRKGKLGLPADKFRKRTPQGKKNEDHPGRLGGRKSFGKAIFSTGGDPIC